MVYLFRLVTTPNTSSSQPTNELGQSEKEELELCYEENRKLAQIWRRPDKSSIWFVAIDLNTYDINEQIITDIGIASWCLDKKSKTKSYYWCIDHPQHFEDNNTLNKGEPFAYGKTQLIDECNIGPSLSEKFNNTTSRHETVCLVGHDIDNKIKSLKPYWEAPSGFLILDTQKIWKAQHRNITDAHLEQCLLSIPTLRHQNVLTNSGNRAQAVIQLLRTQGPISVSSKAT
ncbi:hypothetical protein F4809DRAFT_399688 [Biscogniauxia mediterranea]|nr:hypothetical protein F4809DRAFT_399688 [Biscogniauxia mediterranea]